MWFVTYCHKNFGPLKILVWATKIYREIVPPGLNFSKMLVHPWRIGPLHKVYYSGTVKHRAMSNVLSSFVHLLNGCSKNGYINVVAIHTWFNPS